MPEIEDKMLKEIGDKLVGLCAGQGNAIYDLIGSQILSIIARYCVIEEEGKLPDIWDGKGEVKSALTYRKELDSYRKVRKVNDHS